MNVAITEIDKTNMEAGIVEFIETYARGKGLDPIQVAMYAGAMSKDAIVKQSDYNEFVMTLNAVAPQLVHYIELAKKG